MKKKTYICLFWKVCLLMHVSQFFIWKFGPSFFFPYFSRRSLEISFSLFQAQYIYIFFEKIETDDISLIKIKTEQTVL
jgi:hypothetical protein